MRNEAGVKRPELRNITLGQVCFGQRNGTLRPEKIDHLPRRELAIAARPVRWSDRSILAFNKARANAKSQSLMSASPSSTLWTAVGRRRTVLHPSNCRSLHTRVRGIPCRCYGTRSSRTYLRGYWCRADVEHLAFSQISTNRCFLRSPANAGRYPQDRLRPHAK